MYIVNKKKNEDVYNQVTIQDFRLCFRIEVLLILKRDIFRVLHK